MTSSWVRVARSMHTRSDGGSADRAVIAVAVIPRGAPLAST